MRIATTVLMPRQQKVLLALDEDPDGDCDGIRKRNALQWLLDK